MIDRLASDSTPPCDKAIIMRKSIKEVSREELCSLALDILEDSVDASYLGTLLHCQIEQFEHELSLPPDEINDPLKLVVWVSGIAVPLLSQLARVDHTAWSLAEELSVKLWDRFKDRDYAKINAVGRFADKGITTETRFLFLYPLVDALGGYRPISDT